MRICHLLTNRHGGGLVYAQALAQAVAARGDEVAWLFVDSLLSKEGAALTCRVAFARADLIHCHGVRAGMVAAAFGRGPIVLTPHGSFVIRRTSGVQGRLAVAAVRTAARRARAVICVSRDELRDLQPVLRAQGRKLRLVLNGSRPVPLPSAEDRLAARRGLGIDGTAPVLAFVARVEPHKDPLLAIHAFAHLRELLPEARLLIAGDGSLGGEVRRLNVEGVLALGELRSAHSALVAADVVLNTSHWEGLSLSLLEAMWLGRPVLAVAAAGNREAVGDAGVVIESRDAQTIGVAAASLLADRPLLQALGAAARHRAELLFDGRRMVDETLAVYEDCSRRPAHARVATALKAASR
jgi:glycosyltransferase involved in cell wall biosynthesis